MKIEEMWPFMLDIRLLVLESIQKTKEVSKSANKFAMVAKNSKNCLVALFFPW